MAIVIRNDFSFPFSPPFSHSTLHATLWKSSSCIIFFDYYWRIECAKKHTQQCRFLEAEKDNHDDDDDSFREDEEVEKKSIE